MLILINQMMLILINQMILMIKKIIILWKKINILEREEPKNNVQIIFISNFFGNEIIF